MQEIKPQLTNELSKHIRKQDVWHAEAFPIKNFRELMEHVARLAYANRNQLLFFRGQDKDYQSKAGGSTLYPAIYRGDNLPREELEHRFRQLAGAEKALAKMFKKNKIEGSPDVSRKRYIQWSILQHYEVFATPLLDVTQSLRIACSFAQLASTDPTCYVYVLGFPYPTNRISINSEEDIVNIRLLSICPPSALRPYFQEGYMAGTPDVMSEFDTKTELDFRNRLVAKFAIPRAKHFWNEGVKAAERTTLYPSNDRVEELCKNLLDDVQREQSLDNIGQLLVEWAKLEERLLPRARQLTERNISLRDAINTLEKNSLLSKDVAAGLDKVRRVRNSAAHAPGTVEEADVDQALKSLRELSKQIF
jgi:FRG domain